MILVKTEKGQQVLKDRSVPLTPRQRAAFILFDGKRTVAEVLQASQGLGEDVDQLVELGLLGRPAPAASAFAAAADSGAAAGQAAEGGGRAGARTAQQRYQDAYRIATQLTASLGLRGFRLNLAVEAARTCEELSALAPKLRAALGPEKTSALERALAS